MSEHTAEDGAPVYGCCQHCTAATRAKYDPSWYAGTPTREDLVRFLHNEGDGGIWESFDRANAETVADALIASGLTRVTPPGTSDAQ